MRRDAAQPLTPVDEAALAAREAELTAEVHALVLELATIRVRRRAVERALVHIAEERETAAIDKLLGLA